MQLITNSIDKENISKTIHIYYTLPTLKQYMLSLSLSFSLVHPTAYRYIHPYIYNLHFERAQTELFTIFVLSVNLISSHLSDFV